MQKPQKIMAVWMLFVCIFLFTCFSKVYAQWIEQTITLKPGWNSLYLEVDPRPNECDIIFKDIPISSVWTWNPDTSSVRYIQNPDNLMPKQSQWLVYFPPSSPEHMLTNLYILLSRRAYLIKLEGEQIVNWTVVGRPCLPKITWKPDSFNFVGFHLAPGQEPFFDSFLAHSPAHAGQVIYRLNEEDVWEKVAYPASTPMKSGEAYWVYCHGPSDYIGPLLCQVEQGDGLNYGKKLLEQKVLLRNLSSMETDFSLRLLNSKDPVDESMPPVAGQVPLLYWRFDPQTNMLGWNPIPDSLLFTTGAGREKSVRLAVKLADMAPTGISQSIIEITNNGKGMRIFVPVSAIGRSAGNNKASVRGRAADSDFALNPALHCGLWVGDAVITHVSRPIKNSESYDPNQDLFPTASKFQFRLIIHYGKEEKVDELGNLQDSNIDSNSVIRPRLLREVMQMWKKGSDDETGIYEQTQSPIYPYEMIDVVQDPGCYVLVTDKSLLPFYSGVTLQSGKLVGRRISSAAFGFQNVFELPNSGNSIVEKITEKPLVMNIEPSPNGGTILSRTITINPDDPLNPYKHKFHPDHDNLTNGQERKPITEEGLMEVYAITRDIRLEFSSEDPGGSVSLGWGTTDIGGTYLERVNGLHKDTIFAKGYFHLHKVSQVDTLISR